MRNLGSICQYSLTLTNANYWLSGGLLACWKWEVCPSFLVIYLSRLSLFVRKMVSKEILDLHIFAQTRIGNE